MKVLITGGCGFVGSNCVEYFLNSGYTNLTLYDSCVTGRIEYIEDILNRQGQVERIEQQNAVVYRVKKSDITVCFRKKDIRDADSLIESAEGCDALVHLAAHTEVVASLEDPGRDMDINIRGTFNALEAARKTSVKRFILASSNAVAGEQPPPVNENMVPKPLSPYGASKLAGEGLCSSYYHSYGLETVSLRFANVYGPFSEHKTSVIAKFLRRVKQGKPLEIYGDGGQTRDFIHAQDIAQAVECALSVKPKGSEPVFGEVYQIATAKETSITHLATLIRELARQKGAHPPKIIHSQKRKGEIEKNYSDITRARCVLGFTPEESLKKSLDGLWEETDH